MADIKINDRTKQILINKQTEINKIHAEMKNICQAYLDALNITDNYDISQDFSKFVPTVTDNKKNVK